MSKKQYSKPKNNIQKIETEPAEQKKAPQVNLKLPPIAGFWRRFFAFSIDASLLAAIGNGICLAFSSFFFSIGPYGRFIGLLFILPYFGIMNSKICGGQTIGERWMKIAVCDINNQPVELGRSILRILILATPFLLYRWSIPLLQNYVMAWFTSLLVYGIGGMILFTMVFNQDSRQGLHDLAVGTYVVYLPGRSIKAFPETPQINWKATGIWMGLVAVGVLVVLLTNPSLISQVPKESSKNLYNLIWDASHFFTLDIKDQMYQSTSGDKNRYLIIDVWYKGRPGEDEKKEAAYSIAKTVLENVKNIQEYDDIHVVITSAYEIGVATGSFSATYSRSVDEWRKEIYPNGSSSGFIPSLAAMALAVP